ncbi:hypothetical protein [Arthrobacter methylotrophus]|uniref:hypothetical protein n=1 Tax=Arthrobacter methylotrophus TaxID=121291 RepID=UPI0031EF8AEF
MFEFFEQGIDSVRMVMGAMCADPAGALTGTRQAGKRDSFVPPSGIGSACVTPLLAGATFTRLQSEVAGPVDHPRR